MNSYVFSILSAALFVAGVSAQTLTVNTPTDVLSCTPLLVTWSGGIAPYILSVHDGNNPTGAAFETFSNLTGTQYTWQSVNFVPNTSLDLTLRDNSGLISQSAPFTVQTGGSTTCLNSTSTAPSTVVVTTPGTGATTNAPATTTGTTPTTPATTAQGKATTGSSGSSTSKASSPSSSGNAAITTGISYGAAGILGAVVAALFV